MQVETSIIEEEAVDGTGVEGLVIGEAEATKTNKQDVRDMRKQLKEELKKYRLDQSKPLDKPAYTVFTNAALAEICASLPTSKDELLDVKGIGNKKLESFGDDILEIVRQHAGEGLAPSSQEQGGAKQANGIVPRPAAIAIESLTAEQRQAAEIALDTENPSNVFISGAAGTGKSHVSKFIIQTLQERKTHKCAPTAPTGVAAINVGGST